MLTQGPREERSKWVFALQKTSGVKFQKPSYGLTRRWRAETEILSCLDMAYLVFELKTGEPQCKARVGGWLGE